MSLSYIGSFAFVSLDGQPQVPKQRLQRLARPGVDGTGFMATGRRGEPFVLRSLADFPSFAAADLAPSLYAELITGLPVPLVWNGSSHLMLNYMVVVLDVRRVEVRAVAGIGVNVASPGGICVCDWLLDSVELWQVPQED